MPGERFEILETHAGSVLYQANVGVKIRNGQPMVIAAGQRKVGEPTALVDVANGLLDEFGRKITQRGCHI